MKRRSFFRVVEPYLYLAPAMIFFVLFLFWPFFKTIRLSFAMTTPLGEVASNVGLSNYISIFTSQKFLNSLFVTFKYAIMTVVFSIAFGFILAIVSSEDIKGTNFFRTVFALPMAISAAAASVVFMFIFHSSMGILNKVLGTNIGWLTDPKYALIAVTLVTVWMNIGLNFIYVTAALQSVPMDLYESASLEGAGFFDKHRHITIPCISPTLFFLLIINVINAGLCTGKDDDPGRACQQYQRYRVRDLSGSVYEQPVRNGMCGVYDSLCNPVGADPASV